MKTAPRFAAFVNGVSIAYATWPEAKARAIVEHVRRLEDFGDARTLTALCRRD